MLLSILRTISDAWWLSKTEVNVTPAAFYHWIPSKERIILTKNKANLSSPLYLSPCRTPDAGVDVKSEFSQRFNIVQICFLPPYPCFCPCVSTFGYQFSIGFLECLVKRTVQYRSIPWQQKRKSLFFSTVSRILASDWTYDFSTLSNYSTTNVNTQWSTT